jgi:hypothetical protein
VPLAGLLVPPERQAWLFLVTWELAALQRHKPLPAAASAPLLSPRYRSPSLGIVSTPASLDLLTDIVMSTVEVLATEAPSCFYGTLRDPAALWL